MAEAKKATKKTTKSKAVSEKPQTKPESVAKVTEVKREDENGNTQKNSETAAESTSQQASVESKPVAKAGKRSAKALAEQDLKVEKEERKAKAETQTEESAKPKAPAKPARSRLERRGKKYRQVSGHIDKDKTYALKEAMELVPKTSITKFDASVELHVRLGVDPKQADQNIRDMVVLPAGSGKSVRIAVFADPEHVTAAKKAGADIALGEEFLQQLDKEKVDFDVLIATPVFMPKLGKYARLLGPKGLMPNPKSGTVTTDVAKAVAEAKAGRLEYRVDSTGIVHILIGKVSFGGEKLLQNAQAVMASIKGNKPSSLKGAYVQSIFVTTTMGPSVSVSVSDI